MNGRIVTGVDIGGSHISASLIDIQQRRIISSSGFREEVNSAGSVESILDEWCHVIGSCFAPIPSEDRKIGIAMPGPVDYETGICYIRGQNKYESLYGHNLKELLAEGLKLPVENILMINDAAGFLAGEMFIGAGRGFEKMMGLTLGTGLGSAWSDEGIVADADLWHHPFLDGKAEDYLSGPWLLAECKRISGQTFRNVEQMAKATPGNKELEQVFENFGTHLGLFLAPYVRQRKPELVILGGNIARAGHFFKQAMKKSLQQEALSNLVVKTAEIGEAAALVGAASMWEEKLSYSE